MEIFFTVLTIILQLIVGQLFGVGVATALGVGDGWEVVVISLGNTLGVWGVGASMAYYREKFSGRPYWLRFMDTIFGSALGGLAIWLSPPIGFVQVVFPLLGAMVGYYMGPRFGRSYRPRS